MVVLVLAIAAWSQIAVADTASNEAAARDHYQRGTTLFSLGEFAAAIAEYKAAFTLKSDPTLLYNIAQAYRLSNDLSHALFFYKSFLSNQPNAENRPEVEDRIKKLEEQLAEQRALVTAPPADAKPAPPPSETKPAPPPSETKPEPATEAATPPAAAVVATKPPPKAAQPIYKKWWLWTAVGVGVAAIAVGVGVGVGRSTPSAPSTSFGNTPVF